MPKKLARKGAFEIIDVSCISFIDGQEQSFYSNPKQPSPFEALYNFHLLVNYSPGLDMKFIFKSHRITSTLKDLLL